MDAKENRVSEAKKQASIFFRAIFLSTILIKLRGIIFNKFFTNYLEQEEFGNFNFLIQTATFFGGVSVLGLDNAIFRFTSIYSEQGIRRKISNLFVTCVFIVSAVFILIFGGYIVIISLNSDAFEDISSFMIAMIGILGFFILIRTLLNVYVQAERRWKAYILLNVIAVYLNLCLAVIFSIFANGRVKEIILAYIISYGLFLILYIIKFFQDNGIGTFSKEELVEAVKFSAPGFFLTPLINFFNYLQYFLLNHFSGSEAVGLFVICVSLTGFLNIPLLSASYSFRSLQYGLFDSKEHSKLKSLTNKVTRVYVSFYTPMILIIWYNAALLIEILSNATFITSETLFGTLILGVGYLFKALLHSTGQSPYFFKETKKIGKKYFYAVIISLLLSLVLVPVFGIIGIALVFTIHDILRWFFVFSLAQNLFSIEYSSQKMVLVLIPAVVSTIVFLLLNNIFPQIAVFLSIFSITIYFCLIFGFKILTFKEIEQIIRTLLER